MLNKYKCYKIVIITKTINLDIYKIFEMVKMHKKNRDYYKADIGNSLNELD